MTSSNRTYYTTEDGVALSEGDPAYDYYTMEPIIIGAPCGTGDSSFAEWFYTQSFWKPAVRSRATMLNGARICTMEYAAGRDFPGAKEALAKIK